MQAKALRRSATPLLVLAASFPAAAIAAAPGDGSPDETGLSAAEWSGVLEARRRHCHEVRAVDGGHEARNVGQAWSTRFDGQGFQVRPDRGSWTWGLELQRYGFAGSEVPVASPCAVRREGSRLTYVWDDLLEEWYVNDGRGVEHGFTLHGAPVPRDAGTPEELLFSMAVHGGLRPDVSADGRGVGFLDGDGVERLNYAGLVAFDADGRDLDAALEWDGTRLNVRVDVRGACYPVTIDPVAQQFYLKASNTDAGDWFGGSIALSGDTLVIGARGEESAATGVGGDQANNDLFEAGAVYVFERAGVTWAQTAYLKASNTGDQDGFGGSVDIDGDTIVVGATGEDSAATGVNGDQHAFGGFNTGAVYVFVRDGASWSQQAYIKAPTPGDSRDGFGGIVSISGDTLAVSARDEDSAARGINGNPHDNGATDSGAVFVYVREGTRWSRQAYIKSSNSDPMDQFGISMALSGDTLAVGAFFEGSGAVGIGGDSSDNSASRSGAVYVFQREGETWTEEAYIKASNAEANDYFGQGLDLDGDRLVVGATQEDGSGTGLAADPSDNGAFRAGAAYVFERGAAGWEEIAYLKPLVVGSHDLFGLSVSISGDLVVIGAPNEDSIATGVNGDAEDDSSIWTGAAYVFGLGPAGWVQYAYLKASNTDIRDRFGTPVHASGNTVFVSAVAERSEATGVNGDQTNNQAVSAGAVYVFNVDTQPGCQSYCSSGPNQTGNAALITCSGDPNASLVLRSSPVPNTLGRFFYGPSLSSGTPFGDGNLCVGGATQGLPMFRSTQNVALLAIDYSAPYAVGLYGTRHFQHWFRSGLTTGAGFDTSNGLAVTF